jgi:hypothetical protein
MPLVRLVRSRLVVALVPILLAQLERLRLAVAPVPILMALVPTAHSQLEVLALARVRLLRRAADCSAEYRQQVRWSLNPALRLSR